MPLVILLLCAGLVGFALVASRQPAPLAEAPPPLAPWSREPIQPAIAPIGLDSRKIALGRALFEDPRLSGSEQRACATCHDVRTNGAHPGKRTTNMDTPTIFNASASALLGWEGHDRALERQALATIQAAMIAQGVPLETRLDRLRRDDDLSRRFHAVYGRDIDAGGVLDALAAYERALVTPGSRFDRWLSGEAGAIDAQERRGYARFKQLGCVSCHQGRNIGGNLLQRHGIFRPLAAANPAVLRVPSLRNVAATAPYFHDGSAATLEAAVERMAAAQLDVDLTREQVSDIAAFLHTLTGAHEGRRVRAPR